MCLANETEQLGPSTDWDDNIFHKKLSDNDHQSVDGVWISSG